MNNRKFYIYVLLGVSMLVSVLLSYSFMAGRKTAASRTQNDLQKCGQIVEQMQTLQQKPRLASDHERHSSETTSLIERAAGAGGISSGSIKQITPQQPGRIKKTSYKEKPTSVIMTGITLRQLVTMAQSLSGDDGNLSLKSIKMTAPDANDTGDKWDVELVLVYLIYDPIDTLKKEF